MSFARPYKGKHRQSIPEHHADVATVLDLDFALNFDSKTIVLMDTNDSQLFLYNQHDGI